MERGERKGGGREVRRGRGGWTEGKGERDGRQRRDQERKGKDLQWYIIAGPVPRLSPVRFP